MSGTQRWAHPSAFEGIDHCRNGTCTHYHWLNGEWVKEEERCLHFASEKSLTRDRRPFNPRSNHRFSHGMRNSRENLIEKNRELSLKEALDESFSPRMRKNHSRPYNNTKEWERMIAYSEATRWKYPYCPNNRDHNVTGWSDGAGARGWHCLTCNLSINE